MAYEIIKFSGTAKKIIQAHAYGFRLITATLDNRMNEIIALLGEGHEREK